VKSARCVFVVAIVACTAGDDVPAPRISSVNPTHAPPGAVVTIIGDYFCQQPETGEEDPLACENTGSVVFGATPATLSTYTERAITADVPALEPGRVGVSLTVAGRRSNAADFIVDAQSR
jgi:hypothetical protein